MNFIFKIWKWLTTNDDTFSVTKSFDAKSVMDIHQLSSTTHYTINVPGHPPRTESDVFTLTKHQMVAEEDQGCWICGSKQNREVHHFHLEWSLADAADWAKVKALHPDFPYWDKIDPNDETTFKHFVDSTYNCIVLCMLHHRQHQGIHQVPYPIWSFQKIKKDDFEFFPESKGVFDIPVEDLS